MDEKKKMAKNWKKMKEVGRLRKELEKMKKQCMHCMALRKIKNIELKQRHYLFNCGRMDLRGAKRMYKGMKKVIHDKWNLAKFRNCTKCFMSFEWCNKWKEKK